MPQKWHHLPLYRRWSHKLYLFSDTSWHHQQVTRVVRDDTYRLCWSHDTRLLYTPQHSYRASRHYFGGKGSGKGITMMLGRRITNTNYVVYTKCSFPRTFCIDYWARGGEDSQKNWVGLCGPLPKTHTLFMTKICDIPYPIYDLTLKSKPCFWPAL